MSEAQPRKQLEAAIRLVLERSEHSTALAVLTAVWETIKMYQITPELELALTQAILTAADAVSVPDMVTDADEAETQAPTPTLADFDIAAGVLRIGTKTYSNYTPAELIVLRYLILQSSGEVLEKETLTNLLNRIFSSFMNEQAMQSGAEVITYLKNRLAQEDTTEIVISEDADTVRIECDFKQQLDMTRQTKRSGRHTKVLVEGQQTLFLTDLGLAMLTALIAFAQDRPGEWIREDELFTVVSAQIPTDDPSSFRNAYAAYRSNPSNIAFLTKRGIPVARIMEMQSASKRLVRSEPLFYRINPHFIVDLR